MNEARQLEIAKAIIKAITRKNATLKSIGRCGLENMVKETGVPVEDLQEFLQPIVQEILNEAFKR